MMRLSPLIPFFTCIFCWILPATGMAQDAGVCRPELDAKAAKNLERGLDKKKYDADKRQAYLETVLEENEEAVPALAALGQLIFQRERRQNGPLEEARVLLTSAYEACPEFDPEIPYTLGTIAWAGGQFSEALEWYGKFLAWEERTGQALRGKQLRQRDDVIQSLPELRFLVEYNAHADSPPPQVLTAVASSDQEYLPALSADGTLLFFTRAGERKAKGDLVSKPFEKFTWARRENPGQSFDSGEAMEDPFNRTSGYGGASISVDNRSLFLAIKTPTGSNPENIDLYSAQYELLEDTGDEIVYLWSEPAPLAALNTSDGWESQPAISPDGKWLYFAAVRPGTTENEQGEPSIDILVSQRGNNGEWQSAQSLPAPINTRYSDKAPFLHPDGQTLYFASNRAPGGGGYDIWMSRRDTAKGPADAGAWSPPINLGIPLNTEGDEHGLITSADGKTAYFASRRPGTRGLDIMTWTLPESVRAKASVVVRGQLNISDELKDQPVQLELRYAESRKAQAIQVSGDGGFAAVVDLSTNEDVLLVAKAEGAAFSAGILVDQDEKEPALVEAELTVRSVSEAGAAFEIEDIHYASGSARIGRSSLLLLDLFAEYLSETGFSVEIGGHTDDVGNEADNLELSESRARAVREYLVNQGVPTDSISSRGYGESRPRADNATPEGRARNRRTEFKITD